MRRLLRRLPVATLVLAAAALPAAPARANGDPASDYLIGRDTFIPVDAGVPSDAAQRLQAVVRSARAARFPIKVALIRTPADLGTVFSLYGRPQKYAQFLGQELRFVYRGRLLIVMPHGLGYAVKGKPVPGARKVLRDVAVAPDALADAAAAAVQRLARAAGHPIAAIPTAAHDTTTRDRTILVAAVAGAVVLVGAGFLLRRAQRER